MTKTKDNQMLWIIGVIGILIAGWFLVQGESLSEPLDISGFNNADLMDVLKNALEKTGYSEDVLNNILVLNDLSSEEEGLFGECKAVCLSSGNSLPLSPCNNLGILVICDGGEDLPVETLKLELEDSLNMGDGGTFKRTYKDVDYYVTPLADDVNGAYIGWNTKFYILFSAQENDNIIKEYIDTYGRPSD